MLTCFLNIIFRTNCFGQSEVAFSKKPVTNGAPHKIISLIRESWRISNSHSELNFFNLVTKSWKLWPSFYLYAKNLWERMVVFFLGLKYSENLWKTGANFVSSPGSKVKVSFITLPFWPILVIKMLYFITLRILFRCSLIKIKVFEPIFPAVRYIAGKWEGLRRFSVTYWNISLPLTNICLSRIN